MGLGLKRENRSSGSTSAQDREIKVRRKQETLKVSHIQNSTEFNFVARVPRQYIGLLVFRSF